ncbi:helix-turn-helix transcriptional regulator [Polyangium jinanense]|uniref:YafY family transcriptional regulator n=1 Tax=Polyangium jinanense TaxID=2829994 RepID=A0A9X3XB39_9BACT|nr:YafY family protein [Polyangium jinanense]MDC3960997.1 YafY family transcriptional regulator [Polyangium jinanense]MDC3987417.1 YafY family transcriptional regulator [Polyangium jinanense]
MGRTERLFAIIDALRRHRRPVTAAELAAEQGVSVRTLYRDVQTLIGLGAPIEGEAGVGYVLRPGFFLPPLMFTAEELEALVLGARWVGAQVDESLACAAKNALAKIATVSPRELRENMDDTGLWPVVLNGADAVPVPALGLVRQAMRKERALALRYEDESNRITEREIWPVQIAYHEGKQIVAAWCCLRASFRHFRTDRIVSLALTERPYGKPRRMLALEWFQAWERERG